MERKVFRSRMSVLLIAFILMMMLPGFIPTIRSGNIFNPGFYVMTGVMMFIVFIFGGIRYIITDKQLLVKMWGVQYGSVPLTHIKSVKRSYCLLSSPAASLKRLRLIIKFKKGIDWPFALISPVREQEFLEKLKEINPDIDIHVKNRKAWYRIWDWDI